MEPSAIHVKYTSELAPRRHIVLPDKCRLRKPVNEALLKLKENGTYDLLYAKWFGATGP